LEDLLADGRVEVVEEGNERKYYVMRTHQKMLRVAETPPTYGPANLMGLTALFHFGLQLNRDLTVGFSEVFSEI
jgi:hypothetical protein